MTKKTPKRDAVAEAVRPVYLIASSIQYVLGEMLKAKSASSREEFLKRLDEEATYLKINIKLLRKEVERAKNNA